MLWTDESTFYMVGYDRGSIHDDPVEGQTRLETMAIEVREILRAKEDSSGRARA
jgi:hypothetical protein